MKTFIQSSVASVSSTLFLAWLLTQPVRAATTNANEFWISPNPGTENLGTLAEPYDGSTREKFDAAMNQLPPNSVIHLLAGTYQTYGQFGFTVKSGTQVLGSGKEVTVLQLASGTPDDALVIASIGQAGVATTNIVVADLTVDCNYTSGSYTYHGVMLAGTRHTIRRVKLIHASKMSARNSESWGLMIANWNLDHSEGNLIEDCEVSGFEHGLDGANFNAIGLLGDGIHNVQGIIRNNRIFGKHANNTMVFGIICGNDSVIDGNYIEGAQIGSYSESALNNVMFINNVLKNCTVGICLEAAAGYKNLTYAFNQIELVDAVWPMARAFSFAGASAATMTNITILGNNVTYIGNPATQDRFFIAARNVTGLSAAYNTVDSRLTNILMNCANITMANNSDLLGNYRPDLNITMIGNTPVTDFGLKMIGSAGYTPALAALGLPENPLTLLTNYSTQPVRFNTNVQISGNLQAGAVAVNSLFLDNQNAYANPPDYENANWALISSSPGIPYLALVANDPYGFLTGQRSYGPGTAHRSLAFRTFSDTNDVAHHQAQYVFDTAATPDRWFKDQAYWSWRIGGQQRAYIDTNASWFITAPVFSVSGDVRADRFIGDGSQLTGLNTTNTSAGTAIQLSQLSLASSSLVYGSNGKGAAAWLGPQLAVRDYTNIANGATNRGQTLLLNSFMSQEFNITAGLMANVPHGFPNMPTHSRWVVVCKVNDAGYTVGDECDVDYIVDNKGASVFAEGCNATNVFLVYQNGSGQFYLANKATGIRQSGTVARWKAKCYAQP